MHLLLSDGSGGRLSYELLGTDCSSLGMDGSHVSEQPGPSQTSDWGKDENEGLNVCTFQIPCTTLANWRVLCLILWSKRVREIRLEVDAEQRSLFRHLKHQTFTKRLPRPSSVSQSPFLHTWIIFVSDFFDCNTLHNIYFYFLWPSFFCLQHCSESSGYLNYFKRLL